MAKHIVSSTTPGHNLIFETDEEYERYSRELNRLYSNWSTYLTKKYGYYVPSKDCYVDTLAEQQAEDPFHGN